jgi:hypothetical protein
MRHAKETEEIRAWMAVPENIGALYRALLETPAVLQDVFDPYGEPPPFAGRLEMIGMGETRLEMPTGRRSMRSVGALPKTKFIVEQLDRTEKMIVRRINTGPNRH